MIPWHQKIYKRTLCQGIYHQTEISTLEFAKSYGVNGFLVYIFYECMLNESKLTLTRLLAIQFVNYISSTDRHTIRYLKLDTRYQCISFIEVYNFWRTILMQWYQIASIHLCSSQGTIMPHGETRSVNHTFGLWYLFCKFMFSSGSLLYDEV